MNEITTDERKVLEYMELGVAYSVGMIRRNMKWDADTVVAVVGGLDAAKFIEPTDVLFYYTITKAGVRALDNEIEGR